MEGTMKTLREIDPPGDHPLKQYMARVEQAIKQEVGTECFIKAIVIKDESVRAGYWEKRYVVAYYCPRSNDPWVTHNVCIDREGRHLVHDGWYRSNERTMFRNLLERTNHI